MTKLLNKLIHFKWLIAVSLVVLPLDALRAHGFQYPLETCAHLLNDLIEHQQRKIVEKEGADGTAEFELTLTQKEFIRRLMIPAFGKRAIYTQPGYVRTFKNLNGILRFPKFDSGFIVQIGWRSAIKKPFIEFDEKKGQKTLWLPENLSLDTLVQSGDGVALLRSLTIGHPLHPFNSDQKIVGNSAQTERVRLGEPAMVLKQAQVEAMQAIDDAIRAGINRLAVIASTGIGKTVPLLHSLVRQLTRPEFLKAGKKIHFLIGVENINVQQLHADAASLPEYEAGKFRLYIWGERQGKQTTLADLLEEAEKSPVPIVVATTIQSLKLKIGKKTETKKYNQGLLKKQLASIHWDEVHHMGADQAVDLINALFAPAPNDVAPFLYGTSATPVHQKTPIADLFHGNLFSMHLDSAEEFGGRARKSNRGPEAILRQLQQATEAGELTPQRFFWLDPDVVTAGTEEPLYVRVGPEGQGGRWRINPKLYHKLVETLVPVLIKNEFGMITCRDQDEVDAFTEALETVFAKLRQEHPSKEEYKRTFRALHSDRPEVEQKEVKDLLKKKQVNFVVARRMLDESANYPHLSLWIELNREPSWRSFLQRLGRISRPAVGKHFANVVTLFQVNEEDVGQGLAIMRALQDSESRVQVTAGGETRVIKLEGRKILPLDEEARKKMNAKFIGKLQSFWRDRQEVAEKMNQFVQIQMQGIGATELDTKFIQRIRAGLAETENSVLFSMLTNQLTKDHNKEFWDLLTPEAQRIIEGSAFDYRPIPDEEVSGEVQALHDSIVQRGLSPADFEWGDTSSPRIQKLRLALRDRMEEEPEFLDTWSEEIQSLILNALIERERVRILLEQFVERTGRLPKVNGADTPASETQLASEVIKLTGSARATDFLTSLSPEIVEMLEGGGLDNRPVEVRQALWDLAAVVTDLKDKDPFHHDWAKEAEDRKLRTAVQEAYAEGGQEWLDRLILDDSDTLLTDPKASLRRNLAISALKPEERLRVRIISFVQELGRAPVSLRTYRANRGDLTDEQENELLLDFRKLLKKNISVFDILPANIQAVILKDESLAPEILDLQQLSAKNYNPQTGFRIANLDETQFVREWAKEVLDTGRIPGMTRPVGKAGGWKIKDKSLSLKEIQLLTRFRRWVNDLQRANRLRGALKENVIPLANIISGILRSDGDQFEGLAVTRVVDAIRNQFATTNFLGQLNDSVSNLTWFSNLREVGDWLKTNGRMPQTGIAGEAAIYQKLTNLLKQYPPLIDYLKPDQRAIVKASKFWQEIEANMAAGTSEH